MCVCVCVGVCVCDSHICVYTQSQPTDEWSVKYSIRKKGLPVETVALFGRQILEVQHHRTKPRVVKLKQ